MREAPEPARIRAVPTADRYRAGSVEARPDPASLARSDGNGARPCYVSGRRFALAFPATILPAPVRTIPVLDVETVLARLPADARARVVWARKPIEAGLTRLRTEPLTDDLVVEATDEVWKPLLSLSRAFAAVVATNPDEWRARLVDDIRLEEEQLAAFVEQEDSLDTLHWILGLLQSFMGLALAMPPEFVLHVDEATLSELEADDEVKPYLRALVVLMAASETRRHEGDPQRACDLLDVAFLELTKFRAVLRTQGVALTPFPSETVDDRRRGLLASADRLRKALSDEDWRALEHARVRDLR